MISFIFSIKLWVRKTIGFIYLVNIALLSLSPSYNLPVIHIPYIDKLVHICMYLGLSFLAGWSYDIGHRKMKFMYLLVGGVFMYGVLMEILQRTMHNGRAFEFRDMLANLTGAIIGIFIYRYFDKKQRESIIN